MLLWQEYRAGAPRLRLLALLRALRRVGEAGCRLSCARSIRRAERLFVDYAGQTIELVDGRTGEVRTAQIFVAVLGASSYTYAEASWTQTLPDWIGAHVRALTFFGGVPRPDRARQPQGRRAQGQLHEAGAEPDLPGLRHHYGTAILPARPRRPARQGQGRGRRAGSRSAGSWHVCATSAFFALAELNASDHGAARRTQRSAMRRLGVSRRQLFDELDRPALAALAGRTLRLRRVALVSAGSRSTITSTSTATTTRWPHRLLRQQVEARITQRTSSCSTRASVSLVTCWAAPVAATPP